MTTYERDAWDEIADMGSGIIGPHLKCVKGKWLLDESDADEGMKICIVMPTAITGQVLWQAAKIAERDIGLIEEGFVPPRQVREGWSPYTSFQCVRADDAGLGQLITFTSSSWGGRNAFQSVASQYRLKKRSQFPICEFATKERGDVNKNIDPVFRIVAWSDRTNFSELLAPPTAGEPIAIEHHVPDPTADLINDSIPF